MERRIVTVSQINAYIKNKIDVDYLLQNIWVKGEISNFKPHYSGHMYMSLKDETGVIRAVMFKSSGYSLKFLPENGMQVLARGRISVYPRDGSYQLYIEEMEPEGAGALYVAFEQLKNKLEKEGLFDAAKKKPLPRFPKRVGVVTSSTGAAVKDILNILHRRWRAVDILIYPVLVQGDGAAAEIANAISYFNKTESADVLIVGRGGGSQEDLWAFNEEVVARAVSASVIPVISAVGHETDFTICDFVSDLRAPTPSAAAELCVPDTEEFKESLLGFEKRLSALLSLSISRKKERLHSMEGRLTGVKKQTEEMQYTLDMLTNNLVKAVSLRIDKAKQSIQNSALQLDTLSPLKVLARGYSMASKNGDWVRTVDSLEIDDKIQLLFSDGMANCHVEKVKRGEKIEF